MSSRSVDRALERARRKLDEMEKWEYRLVVERGGLGHRVVRTVRRRRGSNDEWEYEDEREDAG